MDNEARFWRLVVLCIAISFCTLVVTVGSCTAYQSALTARAIQKGADPMQASCSIGSQDRSLCVTALLRK